MAENVTNEILVKLIQEGADKEQNIEVLWNRNIKLIRLIIRKLTGYHENDDFFQDMEQQAFIGFHEAISKYNNSFGVKFFTYAQDYIRQSIYRYYDNGGYSIRIPEYMRNRIRKYLDEKSRLENESGGRMAPDKVLQSMGLSPAARRYTMEALQKLEVKSLDGYLKKDDEEAGNVLDMIASGEDVEAAGVESEYQKELHEALFKALWGISKTDREMILAYYFQLQPMPFIAKLRGCTTENVRQHINKGLKAIRTGKHGQHLVEYLPERAAGRAMKRIRSDLESLELTEREKELLM